MHIGATMLRVYSVLALLLAASPAAADNWFSRTFGGKSVKGSGDVITDVREVSDFTEIESTGAFHVSVRYGERQEVLVTFDDNLIDFIETEVERQTLHIYCDEECRSKHTCQVEITLPKLEGVTTRGSGDIDVGGFTGDTFDCRTKGSGDISIRGLVCDVLRCEIDGPATLPSPISKVGCWSAASRAPEIWILREPSRSLRFVSPVRAMSMPATCEPELPKS